MILSHFELSKPIPLSEGQATVLVIEHARLFRDWVQMLTLQHEGEEGAFTLSHEGTTLKFAKHSILIRDPLFESEIESRVGKALLTRLEQQARDELVAETRALEIQLLEYAESLCRGFPISIEGTDSIDVRALIKLLRIAPVWDDSLLSRLSARMRLAQDFLHTQLFIFVGCKAYLDPEELAALYHEFEMQQMRLLLIEPYQHPVIKGESTIIIDQGLCEIRFPQTE